MEPFWEIYKVASFTDAWIETPQQGVAPLVGLSHLLQMRGLKLSVLISVKSVLVASFTDAWIETCIICRKRKANALSHLLQMRGLKRLGGIGRFRLFSRIFYRCVD